MTDAPQTSEARLLEQIETIIFATKAGPPSHPILVSNIHTRETASQILALFKAELGAAELQAKADRYRHP